MYEIPPAEQTATRPELRETITAPEGASSSSTPWVAPNGPAAFSRPSSGLLSDRTGAVRELGLGVEWPTVFVGFWCQALFALGVAIYVLGVPLLWAPIMIWAVAWHASFQHEVIHSHPTRRPWLNRLLVGIPFGLWLPFKRYRDTHLAHHRDAYLTDPLEDPESFYLTVAQWRRLGSIGRAVYWANNTLVGRMIIGPALAIGGFWVSEARKIAADPNGAIAQAWATHLPQAILLGVMLQIIGFPVWLYALTVVYPATALILLRSFVEHRAATNPLHRTAVVESYGLLNLLYLSNNLHALHHERPGLPWYALNRVYRAHREEILTRNAGYLFPSYLYLVFRYAFVPKEHPVHSFARLKRN